MIVIAVHKSYLTTHLTYKALSDESAKKIELRNSNNSLWDTREPKCCFALSEHIINNQPATTMKSILTLGLILACMTTHAQLPGGFSYKDLGLGYDYFSDTSSKVMQGVASPRELLDLNPSHRAMVRAFAERFPGQEAVVLTASLLESFATTKGETAGVYLFLGNKNGKQEVILTNTRIDTVKVNNTFAKQSTNAIKVDSASNYTIVYDRAWYWDSKKRNWRLVRDKKGALQQSVLTSRHQAQDRYEYKTQGYYLSKDLLLKIWKQSGQESLTVFFGQADGNFHLIIPILQKSTSSTRVLHFATDYEHTERSYHRTLANHLLPSGGQTLLDPPPPPKDHNTVRSCQPYCGN